MRRTASSGKKKTRSTPRTRLQFRWDETPHDEILLKAEQSMSLNSPSRANDDSRRFLLKERLSDYEEGVHRKYIEIEAARITEILRHLRDQYRAYFDGLGCKPIADMYWVVFRYGVMDWAIMALRSAAEDYIAASNVDPAKWYSLFDPTGTYYDIFPSEVELKEIAVNPGALSATIRNLLRQTAFDEVFDGGPFGREYQIHITRRLKRTPFLGGSETVEAVIHRRLRAWDEAKPWTEGLATLFKVTQEEVRSQFAALERDAWQAELTLVELSAFEQIAYDHLKPNPSGEGGAGPGGKVNWPLLMQELDAAGIAPGETLKGVAKKTLTAARRKGLATQTWQECYDSTIRVSLDNGGSRTVRREATRSIANAAKKVKYQRAKVWITKSSARSESAIRAR